MRDYFNSEERAKHIIILAMEQVVKDMESSTALTEEEKKCLKAIKSNLLKFNNSTFDRFGDSYRRKIQNTLQINTIVLVGSNSAYTEAISECATEDLEPCVKELMFNCMGCEKCNYKDCAIYNIAVACDIEGTNEDKGCPYKWELE